MESKKKLSIILAVMCVALIVTITSIVVVLVASSANSKNTVDVVFTADRVQCKMEGMTYKQGEATNGLFICPLDDEGNPIWDRLQIDSRKTTYLFESQKLTFSAEEPRVIIEYAFTDVTTDMTIDLVGYPTYYNVNLGYMATSEKIEDDLLLRNNIETNTSTGVRTLGSTEIQNEISLVTVNKGSSAYIYIVIEIDDLMSSARYAGTIQFALTRI